MNEWLPVLAYHEVSLRSERENVVRTMGADCSIPRDRFADQLLLLGEGGFQTATRLDPVPPLVPPAQADNRVVITFDDGHAGNYQHAFPLLAKHGFKGIFFVTTDFVGRRGMMTWAQVREMAGAGMSLQSHCVSHAPLETLTAPEMAEELRASKARIEDATQRAVTIVSLPHGSRHPRLAEAALAAGYTHVCTSHIGYYRPLAAPALVYVPRIPVPDRLPTAQFGEVVAGRGGTVRAWRRSQAVKALAKRALGINNYRRIYRLVHRIKV